MFKCVKFIEPLPQRALHLRVRREDLADDQFLINTTDHNEAQSAERSLLVDRKPHTLVRLSPPY